MGGRGGGTCGATGWDGEIVRKKIDIFGDTFCAGLQNVEALTSVFVRGGSEIPPIVTMGGPGATVAGCFMHNNVGARG